MIQRSMALAEARSRRDRAMDEVEPLLDRAREGPAQREAGGDRCRERAAGTVGRRRVEAGMRKAMHAARAHQDIDHLLAVRVPALHERDLRALLHQGAAGAFHVFGRLDVDLGQNPRFIDVGGDDGRERNETPGDGALGVDGQQPVARGGDHDRVEDVLRQAVAGDAVGDGFDELDGAEHPRFHGLRRQVLGERIELRRDEGGGHGLPVLDAARILRGDGAHDAGAEDAELMERLEVGLDPGSAPGVRPGDGERDSHGWVTRRLAARGGGATFPRLAEDSIATNLTSTIRDLKRRKARGRRGLALVEGVRLVEEAVGAGVRIMGAVVSPELARTSRGTELHAVLASRAVTVQEVTAKVFGPLADTDSPQGIIAIVEPRRWTVEAIPVDGSATLLVIDGVQDPGNVGTLLRTAFALGAGATIVLRGTADVWGPKTLRAAMGATFRHPVIGLDDEAFITWARRHEVTLLATASDGEPLTRVMGKGEEGRGKGVIAIIVGNEGAGIRPHLNAIAAKRVAIPLAQGAESLNVAVAAGILLYEVSHGR